MDGYSLSRYFWDFSFNNPHKIKPNHASIFFFAVEHCNRLGWKSKFGFPTSMAMEATGIKSYSVYKKSFDDLIEFGMFEIIEYSKNQYSSNIIALKENNKALDKALDKAVVKHLIKQDESISESIDSIDKPLTTKQETNKPINKNDLIFNELIISESWLENTAMQSNAKFRPNDVKYLLKKYNDGLNVKFDNKINKTEYCTHFVNWLNKQDKKILPASKNTPPPLTF